MDFSDEICDAIEREVNARDFKIASAGVYALEASRVAAFRVFKPIPSTKFDEITYVAVGFDDTGVFTHTSSPILAESVARCFALYGDDRGFVMSRVAPNGSSANASASASASV